MFGLQDSSWTFMLLLKACRTELFSLKHTAGRSRPTATWPHLFSFSSMSEVLASLLGIVGATYARRVPLSFSC